MKLVIPGVRLGAVGGSTVEAWAFLPGATLQPC